MTAAADHLRGATRINVVGNAGAGKTTVATAIADVRGLPLHHLDTVVWGLGWVRVPPREVAERVEAICGAEAWVVDGLHPTARERADALVFLDLPLPTVLWRGLRRTVRLGTRSRPELPDGYPELRVLGRLLRIQLAFRRGMRERLLASLEDAPAAVHLRSAAEVDDLLRALHAADRGGAGRHQAPLHRGRARGGDHGRAGG